jgi:hypothetical protein
MEVKGLDNGECSVLLVDCVDPDTAVVGTESECVGVCRVGAGRQPVDLLDLGGRCKGLCGLGLWLLRCLVDVESAVQTSSSDELAVGQRESDGVDRIGVALELDVRFLAVTFDGLGVALVRGRQDRSLSQR